MPSTTRAIPIIRCLSGSDDAEEGRTDRSAKRSCPRSRLLPLQNWTLILSRSRLITAIQRTWWRQLLAGVRMCWAVLSSIGNGCGLDSHHDESACNRRCARHGAPEFETKILRSAPIASCTRFFTIIFEGKGSTPPPDYALRRGAGSGKRGLQARCLALGVRAMRRLRQSCKSVDHSRPLDRRSSLAVT